MSDINIEDKNINEKTNRSDHNIKSTRDVWHAKNGKSDNGGAKKPINKKPFIIFGCILIGMILLALILKASGVEYDSNKDKDISGAAGIHKDYIGVLYVQGEIGSDDGLYNHGYILDAIDGMMKNSDNRGMMLFVNTPGGGVYESDEVYLKIKEYQNTTGRPVYAYFASQAASGGYYISASADKILANRNCTTGSIGVIMGTFYDLSGLMDKYGIKAENITSGKNKTMGSITEPLTAEQKKIIQSMVDEAYDQFVDIVAEGRGLDKSYVKKLADGRVYTAKQAKDKKLVDEVVNTYKEALTDMTSSYGLSDCKIYEFKYTPKRGVLDTLVEASSMIADSLSGTNDIKALQEMMESNNDITLKYMYEGIN